MVTSRYKVSLFMLKIISLVRCYHSLTLRKVSSYAPWRVYMPPKTVAIKPANILYCKLPVNHFYGNASHSAKTSFDICRVQILQSRSLEKHSYPTHGSHLSLSMSYTRSDVSSFWKWPEIYIFPLKLTALA